MNVDTVLLDKLAHLSRLHIEDNEKDKYLQSLSDVIDWMSELENVPTEGVVPMTHTSQEMNVFRSEDIAKSDISHEDALKNAKHKDSNYFRVPKVLR